MICHFVACSMASRLAVSKYPPSSQLIYNKAAGLTLHNVGGMITGSRIPLARHSAPRSMWSCISVIDTASSPTYLNNGPPGNSGYVVCIERMQVFILSRLALPYPGGGAVPGPSRSDRESPGAVFEPPPLSPLFTAESLPHAISCVVH
jgi:hypothetical protein